MDHVVTVFVAVLLASVSWGLKEKTVTIMTSLLISNVLSSTSAADMESVTRIRETNLSPCALVSKVSAERFAIKLRQLMDAPITAEAMGDACYSLVPTVSARMNGLENRALNRSARSITKKCATVGDSANVDLILLTSATAMKTGPVEARQPAKLPNALKIATDVETVHQRVSVSATPVSVEPVVLTSSLLREISRWLLMKLQPLA